MVTLLLVLAGLLVFLAGFWLGAQLIVELFDRADALDTADMSRVCGTFLEVREDAA